MIISLDTFPAVETKYERVQTLGILLKCSNSCRIILDVLPFIIFMILEGEYVG
ncbi:hypothetical protein CU037_1272 [Enterococcus faecium]|nr:hypothetical protein [Enterococcus faecium]MBK4875196.1 hypothetical protein [Enterococcus faecium]